MESVDYWPMARPILKTFGGKLKPLSVARREQLTVSSSCGVYVTLRDVRKR